MSTAPQSLPASGSLKPGDIAPDFSLPDQTGALVSLAAFRGQPVIVYFYPKDNTPVCTAQACAFRDEFSAFEGLGAVVLGISSDSSDTHAAFAQRQTLPFRLLSDSSGQVRRAWGVPRTLGLLPGRVTYVLDAAGVVRRVIDSPLRAQRHIREALDELRSMPPVTRG